MTELARDLARTLRLAVDACRLFERTVGAQPDPWQERFLRSDATRVLLNCHRQAGKSTVTGVLAAHEALYQPGSLTLLVSPTQAQSSELFRKVCDAIHAVPGDVGVDAESALRVELTNGSRVLSLPGSDRSVRGYSGVDLLVLDEAARVSDDLYAAVRPMLATSGGRLIALSTPWGSRGWFHHEWMHGGPAWERYRVPVDENPRIPEDFLISERTSLLDWVYQQEYECRVEANEKALFDPSLIDAAFDPDIKPLFGGTR